jgi:hypothetical protein
MLGRRLLLLVALLLAVGAIAAALTPRDLRGPDKTTTPTPTTSTVPSQATGGTAAGTHEINRTVDSQASEEAVVRAHVGDLLNLTVKVPSPDVVELDGLDRFDPADASTPAHFSFFLDRPGQFPIRLQESGREVGRLIVAAKPL